LCAERPGTGEILNDVANRFIHRDLLGRAATFDLTREHLPDLADNVVIADQAGFPGTEELRSLPENAFTAIRYEAGADNQVVIYFAGTGITGTNQVQVAYPAEPKRP
jgi:hypothetical protein